MLNKAQLHDMLRDLLIGFPDPHVHTHPKHLSSLIYSFFFKLGQLSASFDDFFFRVSWVSNVVYEILLSILDFL